MQRRSFVVRGIVQGVGFRPFVHGLATRLSLGGFVRNTPGGVVIEVEGHPDSLSRFERDLTATAPASSQIDECIAATLPARGDLTFSIEHSETAAAPDAAANPAVHVAPDVATCDDCLRELFDPSNRRWRYPFTTCAACGPRLTIVTGAPYDRVRTTMAAFVMCAECRGEYDDPHDRRFHAESIACVRCGPRVRLVDRMGTAVDGDPFSRVAAVLLDGGIAAVKGLGGYHLACDAGSAAAVGALRLRKHRDEKPFAVMFGTIEDVERVCDVGPQARALLLSPAAPIVLLERRGGPSVPAPCEATAPGGDLVGAMLPSTPVHHLLMRAVGGPLVMTSGNRSDEPVAIDDADALVRLAAAADVFLMNDRPIQVRCDDSVSRAAGGSQIPIRRSRGHAPKPVRLPVACAAPVLATGGHLKNTFALASGREAFVSHHVGDLDEYTALAAFRGDIALYERLLVVTPRVVAHDLHPDYESTRYARERAGREGLATVAVQHHHAHVASCMAEHGLTGPVIGVAFDGSGYGGDGTVWGGEFLVGDARAVARAGHLRPIALPGGERAVTEPWRVAASHLLDAGEPLDALAARLGRNGAADLRLVERMITRSLNAPMASSAGRLFDAMAALAGLRLRMSFEGQAAMELESLAARGADSGYPHAIADGGALWATGNNHPGRVSVLDTRPMIAAAAADARAGAAAAVIARRFHGGLAAAITAMCGRLRAATGIDDVVLTGGVFLNAVLTIACERQLTAMGFRVHRHHLVPPGDGGLSLGQLYVAAAQGAAVPRRDR